MIIAVGIGSNTSTWPNEEDCLGFAWKSPAGGKWVGGEREG